MGLNEVVAPVAPLTPKPTVPVNPFRAVIVIVYWAAWPNLTVLLVGEAVIEKSDG